MSLRPLAQKKLSIELDEFSLGMNKSEIVIFSTKLVYTMYLN